MKKNILPAFVFSFLISCNNSEKKVDPLQAKADSLEKEVIAGHDVAMPKSMKIPKLQKQIGQVLDSINKLPAKQQQANASYKIDLKNLNNDLSNADSLMQKWMNEFNLDSFNTNPQKRVEYLSDEKNKIEKVKTAVLSSLQKADSLLKKKS
jgi:hypothetical protein